MKSIKKFGLIFTFSCLASTAALAANLPPIPLTIFVTPGSSSVSVSSQPKGVSGYIPANQYETFYVTKATTVTITDGENFCEFKIGYVNDSTTNPTPEGMTSTDRQKYNGQSYVWMSSTYNDLCKYGQPNPWGGDQTERWAGNYAISLPHAKFPLLQNVVSKMD